MLDMRNKNKLFLIPLISSVSYALNSNQVVREEIKLITSPDELISKDIIRSELLSEYEFKLKLKNLEKMTKAQELELKKLNIENKKLDLMALDLNNQEKQIKLKEEKLNFELKKLLKQEDLFEKYPYTFLGFKPSKLDLIKNVIAGKIEKAKLDNLDILKEINQENIVVLKKQYDILNKLNLATNDLYVNLINYNVQQLPASINNIKNLIEELFNTNILYMKEKFLKLSKDFTRLKTLVNSFIADINNGATARQKLQREYSDILSLYQDFEKTLLEIKEVVLKNLIELKQTNNLKIVDNEIKINEEKPEIMPNAFVIKTNNNLNKLNALAAELKETTPKVKIKRKKVKAFGINNIMNDPKMLEYVRKQLAIEMGVPVAYLKYLTPKDIYEIQALTNKINLLKTILLKLEVDKELTDDEVKVLQDLLKDKTITKLKAKKIYIKYKIIDKLNEMLKKKYLILQRSINKYKRELERKKLEAERLKRLELEKKRLEAERRRRMLELERQRRLEEMKRQKELERQRRLAELKREKEIERQRRIKKIKNHIIDTFKNYNLIGIINNSISLQNKATGEIIYIHPGSVLNGVKIVKILDYTNGIIKVKYKGIEETINLSNIGAGIQETGYSMGMGGGQDNLNSPNLGGF